MCSHTFSHEAIAWAQRVGATRTILTHMHADLDYRVALAKSPPGVAPDAAPPRQEIRERRKVDVLRRSIEVLRLEPKEAARFEQEVLRTMRRIGAAWMEREAVVLAPFVDGYPQAQENYERAKEDALSELLVFMGEAEFYRPVRDRLPEWLDALR